MSVNCLKCGLPPDMCICKEISKELKRHVESKMKEGYEKRADEDLKIAKEAECCYSHKCKLCAEEVIWSILEHLIDKHPELPETKEIRKKLGELWDKFVESS